MPEHVPVESGRVTLPGDLTVPAPANGLVIFAHGSDSTRRSPYWLGTGSPVGSRQRTLRPYISPSGSAISSTRVPSGSRK
jgi:hypothetical protein